MALHKYTTKTMIPLFFCLDCRVCVCVCVCLCQRRETQMEELWPKAANCVTHSRYSPQTAELWISANSNYLILGVIKAEQRPGEATQRLYRTCKWLFVCVSVSLSSLCVVCVVSVCMCECVSACVWGRACRLGQWSGCWSDSPSVRSGEGRPWPELSNQQRALQHWDQYDKGSGKGSCTHTHTHTHFLIPSIGGQVQWVGSWTPLWSFGLWDSSMMQERRGSVSQGIRKEGRKEGRKEIEVQG